VVCGQPFLDLCDYFAVNERDRMNTRLCALKFFDEKRNTRATTEYAEESANEASFAT
jgi:hypothetical protein